MNIIYVFLMLSLIGHDVIFSEFPIQNSHLKLSAKVYAVPPIQGMKVGSPESSTVSAVNVTTNFPNGIVLISTDILSLKWDELIEARIRETLIRGGTELPRGGEIGIIAPYTSNLGLEFTLDGGSLRNQVKVLEGDLRGTKFNLTFYPFESSKNELITKICFEERRSNLAVGIYTTLLDRTFGIPLSQVYLIGFPSIRGGRGCTVYWLAVLVTPSTSASL